MSGFKLFSLVPKTSESKTKSWSGRVKSMPTTWPRYALINGSLGRQERVLKVANKIGKASKMPRKLIWPIFLLIWRVLCQNRIDWCRTTGSRVIKKNPHCSTPNDSQVFQKRVQKSFHSARNFVTLGISGNYKDLVILGYFGFSKGLKIAQKIWNTLKLAQIDISGCWIIVWCSPNIAVQRLVKVPERIWQNRGALQNFSKFKVFNGNFWKVYFDFGVKLSPKSWVILFKLLTTALWFAQCWKTI